MENKTILEVKELKKYFPKQKDILGNVKLWLKAVDDVTFTLEAGKTIKGIVITFKADKAQSAEYRAITADDNK